MMLEADRLTFAALSDLDLNGHFLPEHLIVAFQPFGNCWVIWRIRSVNVEPRLVKFQLCTTPEVSVGNASAVPSQFSSIRLPRISVAPGRIAALPSLQSCPAVNPSPSPSSPPGGQPERPR